MSVRVLAMDGGGVRGLAPAVVLAELESIASQPVSRLFDLIVGCSVGGLLALALASPGESGSPRFAAADMVRLFHKEARHMFRRRPFTPGVVHALVRGPRYESESLEAVLGRTFREIRLGQLLTQTAVVSYDLHARVPVVLRSWDACDAGILASDAARATAAAPTFFEPTILRASGAPARGLIDGGVCLNNPAMCAYALARGFASKPGARGADVLVVSLGTGRTARPINAHRAKRWSAARWVCPILDILMDGAACVVDEQLTQLLGAGLGSRGGYVRLDPDLAGEPNIDERFDSTRRSNLRAIEVAARRLVTHRRDDLRELAARLVRK